MKVLLLEIGGSGGIAHYTWNLAQALAGLDAVTVTLLSGQPYELDTLERKFELLMYPFRNASWVASWKKIIETTRRVRPDVLHVQTLLSVRRDWLPLILLRLLGVRIVYTAHNVYPHDRHEKSARGMKECLRAVYESVHHVVTHAGDNVRMLTGELLVRREKVSVVSHGNYCFYTRLSPALDRQEARERLGLAKDAFVFLCFGTVRAYKGLDTVIEGFARIRKEKKGAVLLLAGRGSDDAYEQVDKTIAAAGVGECVVTRFGYVPLEDMGLFFSAADCVICGHTRSYGSGAVHAALGYARPVLMSRLEQFAGLVDDGVNGMWFDAGSPDDLARAMNEMAARTADEILRMGEHSLRIARERYSWNGIAKETRLVYERVRGRRPAVIAPDCAPPFNERWVREVLMRCRLLNADRISTRKMATIAAREDGALYFSSACPVRYLVMLPYLVFRQRSYGAYILEGSPFSFFNRTMYRLVRLRLIDPSKVIGVSHVAYKWITPSMTATFIKPVVPYLKAFVVHDEKERDMLTGIAPGANCIIVRPGVQAPPDEPGHVASCTRFELLFLSAPMIGATAEEAFQNKGIAMLLESFSRFAARHDACLTLVWRNRFYEELCREIAVRGLTGSVEVINHQVDTAALYRRTAAVVFPAAALEGSTHYPMSVMESLSYGRPVVVSDVVAIAGIVKKHGCGTIFSPAASDLSNALIDLYEHYDAYRARALDTFRECFDYEKNIQPLRELLA